MFDVNVIRLMAITDGLRGDADELVRRATAATRGGATCVQLRLKDTDARTLVQVARLMVSQVPVPIIVNDRVDVALVSGAAGVHLGPDDLPVAAARKLTPPGFIIGASVGNDAEVPNARGADYVGIGPIFPTASKPDAGGAIGVREFARLAQAAGLPAVGVGGITAQNARDLIVAGGSGVATIAGIFGNVDPEQAARGIAIFTGCPPRVKNL